MWCVFVDSAYFEFGIVIWISGTFEKKLKDDFKFKSEISLLVRINCTVIQQIFMIDFYTPDIIKIDTIVVMKCLNSVAFFKVKDNFLPKEYRNIFQLEVATVT